MLNERQERLCAESRWDFSDLSALFLNCTLKRSPELSHTEGLIPPDSGRQRDVVACLAAFRSTPAGGAWRSPVARLLWEQEVPSSNLGAPTIHSADPNRRSSAAVSGWSGLDGVPTSRGVRPRASSASTAAPCSTRN